MIDEISSGVKRLNDMAHTVQDEIHEHDRLVDEVEIQVDVSQTRLEHNKRQVERLLHTNSVIASMFPHRLVPNQDHSRSVSNRIFPCSVSPLFLCFQKTPQKTITCLPFYPFRSPEARPPFRHPVHCL